jgi:superfamily II DNA/RNA helicase
LWVQSEPGAGATFAFVLPTAEAIAGREPIVAAGGGA